MTCISLIAVEWWTSLLFNKIVFRLFENHNSFLYTFIRKLSLLTIYYFIYWWKQKIKVQNISFNARSTFKFVVCNNNLPKNRNCTYLFLIAFCKLQHWLHWCNLQRHLLVRYNIIRCSILSYEKESYIRTCIHTKIFSELHHRWIFHHKTFWMTINYVYTYICLCKYDKARYRLSFERKMSLLFIYINSY